MSLHWLWGTLPLGAICLILLPVFVWRLVKALRVEDVLSLPLVPEQEVAVEAAGPLVLHAEGPRLTRAFGGLDYRLVDLADGRAVPLSGIFVKSSSSGLSRSRLSLRKFAIDRPGRYRLTVTGIEDPAVGEKNRLIVTRDRRGRTTGIILVVVFSAVGLLASVVASAVIFAFNP